MTRNYYKAGRLPRLSTPVDNDRSPQDLRGANYSKLQHKHRQAPNKEKVVFLPTLENGEGHPLPYYSSGDVSLPALAEVPWKADEKRKLKAQAETFNRDRRLQTLLLDDLVGDAIQEEIVATASIVLEESKYQEETDRNAVGLMEEVFLMPEVQYQVYLNVWSLLYDIGRSLSHDEYLELKKKEDELILDSMAKDALLAHVLEGENWADDLKEEKILSGISWEILVFHYHRNLQENGLSKNVALKMLQERLVAQAAGEEVFKDGVLDTLEEDLTHRDEIEKLTTPPRQG